eukprot:scaffold342_cov208-Ochromonas_danica.AAC.13
MLMPGMSMTENMTQARKDIPCVPFLFIKRVCLEALIADSANHMISFAKDNLLNNKVSLDGGVGRSTRTIAMLPLLRKSMG